MAIGAAGNLSDVLSGLPEGILSNIGMLVTILQAAGIAFIIYVAYLVTTFFINLRRYRILQGLDQKVIQMDKKLNLIIKNTKK